MAYSNQKKDVELLIVMVFFCVSSEQQDDKIRINGGGYNAKEKYGMESSKI